MLAGCTQLKLLPYLDQALMLQEFGNDKEKQHKFIKNTNEKFDKLTAAINSGDIKHYKTEQEIINNFGPPILKSGDQALYRHAIGATAKSKAYLYYDDKGNLLRWELLWQSW